MSGDFLPRQFIEVCHSVSCFPHTDAPRYLAIRRAHTQPHTTHKIHTRNTEMCTKSCETLQIKIYCDISCKSLKFAQIRCRRPRDLCCGGRKASYCDPPPPPPPPPPMHLLNRPCISPSCPALPRSWLLLSFGAAVALALSQKDCTIRSSSTRPSAHSWSICLTPRREVIAASVSCCRLSSNTSSACFSFCRAMYLLPAGGGR